MKSSIILFGAGIIALAMPATIGAGDDSWNNLSRVNRESIYTFAIRGGECLRAGIKAVHANSVDVVPYTQPGGPQASPRTLGRDEILRVGDGSGPVFISRQSSWEEVCRVRVWPGEHLHIILKSGSTVTGRPVGCADSTITVRGTVRIATLAKTDVREVDYVRFKPVPPTVEYIDQEAGWAALLFPQVWPYLFEAGVHISVRLYDSSMPEDNSQPACPVPPKPRPDAASH
jgi:hypothetical protein